jgi:hypothetical protein
VDYVEEHMEDMEAVEVAAEAETLLLLCFGIDTKLV